jgi:peptide/nickel transport system permease protein
MIGQRVAPSLILTGTGVAWAILLAIPLGVLAAWKPQSSWSKLASGLTLFSFSAPSFFLCLVAIYIFSVKLSWFPAAGMYSSGAGGDLTDLLRHLVLPAAVVCLGSLGNLVRQTTSAVSEVLGEDYIRTARAKGLKEKVVINKHAFRNTMIPLVTSLAGLLPSLFSGAIITEQVFDLPGIGNIALQAMNAGDIPFIMGYNMFLALLSVLGVLLADLMYGIVDPRVKLE